MSSDLFVLNALANELNDVLAGARVDKITQPETDEVRFFVRNNAQNLCLVASCNSQASRLHLTDGKKQNPLTAPAFCMLLRKYLLGARIDSISIFNQDRTICIEFMAKDEMQDKIRYKIYVELMNRYSNIVFTNANDLILDALKRLPLDESREHAVFKGLTYEPVSNPKTCVFSTQTTDFEKFTDGNLDEFILSTFSGFSHTTAEELAYRCDINHPLTCTQTQRILNTIFYFENIAKESEFAPCIFNNNIYPMPFKMIVGNNSEQFERFTTLSQAFDKHNAQIDLTVRIKAKTKHLLTAVMRVKKNTEKRMTANLEKLKECTDKEQVRFLGELIVSNIYKIQRGDREVTALNYNTGENVKIALDEKLSPSQNANAYFKKYNKLKRTEVFLTKKNQEDELLLDYLSSIQNSILSAELDDDLTDIENELKAIGAIKASTKKRTDKRQFKQSPLEYKFKGFTILKGRNNTENDALTFKIASSNDVWLHLKNAHGAHCIILCQGKIPPDEVIKFSAEITASTQNESAEIDYTERKNVKRMAGGHLAQVTYTNFKTIVVKPNSHNEFLVKK